MLILKRHVIFLCSDDLSITSLTNRINRQNRNAPQAPNYDDVLVLDPIPSEEHDDSVDESVPEEEEEQHSDVDNEHGDDADSVESGDSDGFLQPSQGAFSEEIIDIDDAVTSETKRKTRTKRSNYADYPTIPVDYPPIEMPFLTKDTLASFGMSDGVEVEENEVPSDLVKIKGKMRYYLQANEAIVMKLTEISNAKKKSKNKCEGFQPIRLKGDPNEVVIYPKEYNLHALNIPERYWMLTKYNRFNWIVPESEFNFS